MKEHITLSISVLSAFAMNWLGGWDVALKTLLILMATDYLLGLIVALMRRSKKTASGGLSSVVGWYGLFRKITVLVLVIVGVNLDALLDITMVRSGIIIFYTINELISITENAELMGLDIPDVLKKVIELLKGKAKQDDEKGN